MISRLKAFAAHFLISAAIISIFICFVLFIWYPYPFDYFYSPWDVIKIVLGVDLVVGPLLTLVIYDIKKPISELRRDIAIIILFQLSAFIWGVNVTYNSRPVFLIFSDDTFYMFSRDELDVSALKRKELEPVFWRPASQAYLDPPKSSEELTQLYREYFMEGKPELTIRTDRYLPLKEGFESIIPFSIDVENIITDAQLKQKLVDFIQHNGGELSQYVFFPVKGTSKTATLVFRRTGGELVGLIEVDFKAKS